jgi:hypothetical protein
MNIKLIGRELYNFALAINNVNRLYELTNGKNLYNCDSEVEDSRSIELQILEKYDDGAVFAILSSDGPSGSLGIDVNYGLTKIEWIGELKLFVNGVPTDTISIDPK